MTFKLNKNLPYKIAIAPMVRVSTPQMRCLWHIIAPELYFYTEMYHVMAVIFNKNLPDLFPSKENGTKAFQIAGNNAENILKATSILSNNKWQEINLNAGCPAPSARKGEYGLSLLKDKSKLKECLQALKEGGKTKVSLKCRIGVDKTGGEDFLYEIIDIAKTVGIDWVIVHARMGWLKGLDAKQNRRVPPIDYECVRKVSKYFSDYPIIINGSIDSLPKVKHHLESFPAVMIGRWIQKHPFALVDLQNTFYEKQEVSIDKQLCLLMDKITSEKNKGNSWRPWLMSLMPFLHGLANCRNWRQKIHNCLISDGNLSFNELTNQWYEHWHNVKQSQNYLDT